MDEPPLSKQHEREMLEMFERAALQDYPNPDRIGCPGSDFLRRLAFDRKSVPISDPNLTHITRCSPCYKEFLEFRALAARATARNRITIAAGLLLVAIGVVSYFAGWLGRGIRGRDLKPESARTYLPESLNLTDRSIVRGNETTPPAPRLDSLRLPRKPLALTITLPFASEPGHYEVSVLRSIGDPLAAAAGEAHLENGATRLTVRLDLSALGPGQYLVGIRRVPLNWTYHPVRIE